MRFSVGVALLLVLAACGVPEEHALAAPATLAACPTSLTSKTDIPKGARLFGKVEETLLLWTAEMSLGKPENVKADRVLSSFEQDEDGPLPDGGYFYRYEIDPGPLDTPGQFESYMLACYYGADATLASDQKSRAALVLLPLPYKAKARCDVISGKPGPKNEKRPLISAICGPVK